MNRSAASTFDDEVSYPELFSLFDNVQQYFTDPLDGTFDDVLSTANHLSAAVEKGCTRNVQLRRKHIAKLRSMEDRLTSISGSNESRKAQSREQEQICVDLANRIATCRAACDGKYGFENWASRGNKGLDSVLQMQPPHLNLSSYMGTVLKIFLELKKQYVEASKENIKIEMERSNDIQTVAEKSLNRLRAKLSSDESSFSLPLSTVSNTTDQEDEPME
ncbi:hypothetical protein Y032_0130g1547 [Ancylostoma ceylanicum]|uniref:Uncharacterized protein n=1 Tax=Ancylostoma ceylanicum TaxID=53326 RepID=A0A016T7G9_9BILA|nr:hypothetical protein Y032_0130g1547 [Ancylostoma ceylanicum]